MNSNTRMHEVTCTYLIKTHTSVQCNTKYKIKYKLRNNHISLWNSVRWSHIQWENWWRYRVVVKYVCWCSVIWPVTVTHPFHRCIWRELTVLTHTATGIICHNTYVAPNIPSVETSKRSLTIQLSFNGELYKIMCDASGPLMESILNRNKRK